MNNPKSRRAKTHLNKIKLVEMKGGKCSKCGYDKNISALCFHHTRDKEFSISGRNLTSISWERLTTELEKCELLCHNCHMEIHNPEKDNWNKNNKNKNT